MRTQVEGTIRELQKKKAEEAEGRFREAANCSTDDEKIRRAVQAELNYLELRNSRAMSSNVLVDVLRHLRAVRQALERDNS